MLQAVKNYFNGSSHYAVPTPADLTKEFMDTAHTPDVWWLEMFARHWVFIYDNRMSVFNGGPRLAGSNEGVAYTKRDYTLYKKDLGEDAYPIALRSTHNMDRPPWTDPLPGNPEPIKGELWLLSTDQLISLDNEMENGQAWRRKRISTLVPDRKGFMNREHFTIETKYEMKEIRAWIYEGDPDVWLPIISGGKLCSTAPIYRPKTPKPGVNFYYYFSPTELNDV